MAVKRSHRKRQVNSAGHSKNCEMFRVTDNISLDGFTFVLPSLSVANVPQLAIDLLIESLQMKKIGVNWHAGIVPVIGPPAFSGQEGNTTSCELYCSLEKKVAVIQLRTPVAAKCLESVMKNLNDFLTANHARQVFILSSCFSHERHDVAIQRKLEYVGNKQFCAHFEKQLGDYVGQTMDDKLQLTGQGFATRLFQAVQLDVPIGILFAYVSEGDNVPDAKDLAMFLTQVSGIVLDHSTLRIPTSWRLLFGNAGPIELF